MGIDQLKVLFTYAIALFVLVGGLLFLYFTPADDQQDKLAVVGFMGIALNFVFMRETATNSARQTERAVGITAPPAPTIATSDSTTGA